MENIYQHTDLEGEVFYQLQFPEFWERSYAEKNAYYNRVERLFKRTESALMQELDAEVFARLSYASEHDGVLPDGRRLTEKEKMELLWYEDCFLFSEKLFLNQPATLYCTKDMDVWLCEECFEMMQSVNRVKWVVCPSDTLFE